MSVNKNTGLNNLELYFEPISNRNFGSVCAYKSQLRINAPDIGVLLPSVYLPVAQRTLQASRLSLWAIEKVTETINKLVKKDAYFQWISVYVPTRLFSKSDFFEVLQNILTQTQTDPKKLCLELPLDLLYEDEKEYQSLFEKLRNFNISTMLSDFGDEYCPISKLTSFKTDYVSLSSQITRKIISHDESSVNMAISIIDTVSEQKLIPIATSVNTTEIKEMIPDNCPYFSGKLSGKTRKI